MGEEIQTLYDTNVTLLSNNFLENHLADSNPEYIRVYLYFLWKKNEKLTYENIADALNLTENDVERAVKYWMKQKVISKGKISKTNSKEEKIDKQEDSKLDEQKTEDISKKNKTKDIKDISLYAEKMLPGFSSVQKNLFEYMYDQFDMNMELIMFLIDHCIEKGITTNSYMKKIATSWYEQGIKNVKQAKKYIDTYNISKNSIEKKSSKKTNFENTRKVDYDSMFMDDIKKRRKINV